MKRRVKRLTLHRETVRDLTPKTLEEIAGGGFQTVPCPCTHTCDSCSPCTIGQSCVSGIGCTA